MTVCPELDAQRQAGVPPESLQLHIGRVGHREAGVRHRHEQMRRHPASGQLLQSQEPHQARLEPLQPVRWRRLLAQRPADGPLRQTGRRYR